MGESTETFSPMDTKLQPSSTLPQISFLSLQTIFENSVDAILVSKTGMQVTANPAFLSMFGYSSLDDIAGKPILDIVAPIDHQRITDYMVKRLKGESVPSAYEAVGRKQDGSEFMLDVRVSTYKQEDEVYSLVILRDITEHKLADQRMRDSEERFRLLTEKSVTGIYIIQDTKMVYVNPSLVRMLGYDEDEIVGKLTPRDLIHPDDIGIVMKRLQGRLEGQIEPDSITYRALKKDGSVFYIALYGVLINYRGKPAVMGTLIDVTEQKRAEKALRESKAMLEATFNNMQYPINVGHEGIQIMVNSAAVKLYGYDSAEECINQPIISTIAPDERARIANYAMRRSKGLAAPTHYETRGLKKDGSEFDIEVMISTYTIDDEIYTLGAVRDITEEKRLQAAEREQREFADALSSTAMILNQTLDFETLFERIIDLVGDVVPYDAAGIIQVENGIMHGKSMRGFIPQVTELIETGNFQLLNGSVGMRMIANGQPVVMEFPTADGTPFNEIPGFEAPHTRMGIPVIVQEEVIGFLLLIKREPNFYTQKQIDRMTAFASHIASAYLNARLFERQRELLQQVVLAQEEERQRVARELHDEAGQALTAVTLNLQLLRSEIGKDIDWHQKIDNVIQLAHATAGQIRNISYGLRPPLIDTLGLNLAMQDLCQDMAKRAKIEIVFSGQDISNLSDAVNISLYRILQESLTNVLRHAEATQVAVNLSATRTHVFLSIADNGKGFGTSQVGLGATERRGLGLLGMHERADLINGNLEIQSGPGQGTRVQITVPKG